MSLLTLEPYLKKTSVTGISGSSKTPKYFSSLKARKRNLKKGQHSIEKKFCEMFKVASVGGGQIGNLEAGHFLRFQLQLCHQRSLLTLELYLKKSSVTRILGSSKTPKYFSSLKPRKRNLYGSQCSIH